MGNIERTERDMEQGTINVMRRLIYRWHQDYGVGVAPVNQMARNWELAKRQLRATYLTQEVEDIIIMWARPGAHNL